MPNDKSVKSHDLSALLHNRGAPRSPRDLDERIVQHAKKKADEYAEKPNSAGFKWFGDGWKAAVGVFSVAVIGVSLTFQVVDDLRFRAPNFESSQPVSLERVAEEQENALAVQINADPEVASESLRQIAITPRADDGPSSTTTPANASNSLREEVTPVNPAQSRDQTQRASSQVVVQEVRNRQAELPSTAPIEQDTSGALAPSSERTVAELADSTTADTDQLIASTSATEETEEAVETDSNVRQPSGFSQASPAVVVATDADSQPLVTGDPEPPVELEELLALLNDNTVVATPLGRSSVYSLPDYMEKLKSALDLIENTLTESTISVGPYPAISSPPEIFLLRGQGSALVEAYALVEGEQLTRLETTYRQFSENQDELELPRSMESTMTLIENWISDR